MTLPEIIDAAYKVILALGVLVGVCVSTRNAMKINEVHLTMNSRLTELLASSKAASFSEGAEHARAMQKEEAQLGIPTGEQA